ncbi:MAG: TonB-dependent receptor [Proteobacteria bacterium]|nr:TonB-dependent receptor [Pseudomonadota bacterium]
MIFSELGRTAAAGLLLGLVLAPLAARADGVGQRRPTEVIVVVGKRGSATTPDVSAARERLERIPGAVGVVDDSTYRDSFTQSIGDALLFTPGVFADTSAQRESRISIRGSGLNSSFERRGITVLRDGVPISRAGGLTEFQEIDPISIDYIEVYKGANGLRYGGMSLGGAVNIVSPTGRTASPGVQVRLEGGSFATTRAHGSVALANETADLYVGATGLRSEGYRDHSDVRSVYGHANLGIRLGDLGEMRFYATALSDNLELAGSLGLRDALDNPRDAARPVTIGPFFPGGPVTVLDPGPIADDWDRNLDVYRASNVTKIELDHASIEGSFWFAYRDLDHAITRFAGIIDQEEKEYGGQLRAEGDFVWADRDFAWVVGASVASSDNDARAFENDFGDRGDLRSRSDQDARNWFVYAQADAEITDSWTAIAGLQYLDTKRKNRARFQDTSGQVSESQFNPRVGLLWDFDERTQFFVNANRSFEPASMADLTAGGALDFTPLRAQDAWTFEIGSRGQRRFVAWDLAYYRSWVEDEFVDLPVPGASGFLSRTFNAGDTIHQGIEAGLSFFVDRPELDELGLGLSFRAVYTWNDFFFDSEPDGVVGTGSLSGNQLPAIPEHVLLFEARLEYQKKASVSVNVRHVPRGPYVDFANTKRIPDYTLVGISGSVDVLENLRFFVSGENLGDETFISNLTTVADQSIENANVFTPGQGRAFFGGLEWRY